MKKNLLETLSLMFIATLLIAGCKKEIKETALQNAASTKKYLNECRLISNTSEFGEITYTYNEMGLLDEWNISGYGLFKQEYDSDGRLLKSRFYSDDVLVNTLEFFYEHKKLVKIIWYNGDTEEIADEIFYTYNKKGELLKAESIISDYYTTYIYSPEGNVIEWNFYIGGIPVYTGQNTFLHHHKNPDLATPGVDFGFPYINGAVTQNKWYSSSEKFIFYDEEGNPAGLFYDQDPYKTVVGVGSQNYVTTSDFFDVISGEWTHFKFEYENCGSDHRNNSQSARNTAQSRQKLPQIKNNKISPMKVLKPGSAKSIKQQVKELREQMKITQTYIK